MPPRTSEHQLARARGLRREQTKAEAILWRSLRDRQSGAKFRRQVPVGAFVVDFACIEARLVVEVDGPSHETPAGTAADAWRDRCLSDLGWRVVRVTIALVIGGGDLALAPILAALDQGTPRRESFSVSTRRSAQPDACDRQGETMQPTPVPVILP